MARQTYRVRVRGTCKAGHVTEATSDPGRRTWEGPCATEGCDLPVKGRQVPKDAPAATTHNAEVTDPDAEYDPYETVVWDAYEQPEPGALEPDKREPEESPDDEAGPGEAPPSPPPVVHEHQPPAGVAPRPGFRSRIRRRPDAGRRPHPGGYVPGIFP